jgi:hypothetical protein
VKLNVDEVFDTNSNTFLTVTPRSLEVVFLSPSVAIIVTL